MKLRMDGRVALVTGGSKGLGYAMAHKFAASGAQVCVVARNEDEGQRPLTGLTLRRAQIH
jgi:NAD(P)-dependent dehydrogenase (short-subunit alcohol dehydrogenase family)